MTTGFPEAFRVLTGNPPFPWQRSLYDRFVAGEFPQTCNLPTGLGKTSVVAVWLIALATRAAAVPRRLVYVVNRRTVVDQTTDEVERLRERVPALKAWFEMLAISTLRGQFADNREWSADPSRPAVICGTVDMIGSRLLFSGYGVGFKARPLHAGFLGQDVLLVHDEAHLEPAFQELLKRMKGLRGWTIGKCQSATPGERPPYYMIVGLYAATRADLEAILASPEGQATIADVPNFATGGFTFMFDEEVVLIPYSLGAG